jgi:hypothetical protein
MAGLITGLALRRNEMRYWVFPYATRKWYIEGPPYSHDTGGIFPLSKHNTREILFLVFPPEERKPSSYHTLYLLFKLAPDEVEPSCQQTKEKLPINGREEIYHITGPEEKLPIIARKMFPSSGREEKLPISPGRERGLPLRNNSDYSTSP